MNKILSINAFVITVGLLLACLKSTVLEAFSLPRTSASRILVPHSYETASALHLSKQDSDVISQWPPLSRRTAILQSIFFSTSLLIRPAASHSKSTPQSTPPQDDVSLIQEAAAVLTSLIENWDRATIDCTYADVPRELLESKNKEQLLEKASTFALFDKSTSVVSCKKTNKIVRDYIGVTGKGPCVNIEKRMLKRSVVDSFVDPDNLEEYYSQVELFSQAISRAASLSYAAGSADFDSVNNFAKGEKGGSSIPASDGDNSNLEQARKAIVEAKTSIDLIFSLLSTEDRE